MAHKISFEILVDYAEGRLSEAEHAAVAAQLQADPTAAAQAAHLQHTIALMRTDASEDAPAHVVNRASRLLRQRKLSVASQPQPGTVERPSVLHRILAALTFDSAVTPAFGLRSGASQQRQVLFSAEGSDLDIRIADSGAGFAVSGQVLGPEAQGAVTLANESVSVRAVLNDLGEFALTIVPAGRYTLTLHYGNTEIEVPELELGASNTNNI
jgi:hypothetical protein